MEEKFFPGVELRKRWGFTKDELMERITETHCTGNITFCKGLTPYLPGYRKPYELWNPLLQEAHKSAGTKYTPPLWSVQRPGDLYDSLDDALFRETDIDEFQKKHKMTPIGVRLNFRRGDTVTFGKVLKKDYPNLKEPDAARIINKNLVERYGENGGYKGIKQIQNIIRPLGFVKGKAGRTKKK